MPFFFSKPPPSKVLARGQLVLLESSVVLLEVGEGEILCSFLLSPSTTLLENLKNHHFIKIIIIYSPSISCLALGPALLAKK